MNERGKKGTKIYMHILKLSLVRKKEGERELWEWKRRVRETYENSWLSGRKKHSKNTEVYMVK